MRKGFIAVASVIFFACILCWMYLTMMSQQWSQDEGPLAEFSTKRALEKIKAISAKPHFVGTTNHQIVGDYLIKELEALGLETSVQSGTTLSDWGNLVESRNIVARIKGTNSSKALLLLSHYDSAPHSSSHGAADNAAGVATILEGVRAFLHNKTAHKNDIIILFSDAEELGLNGAALFVTKNNWAKDVGVALNFEARGTAGPSYMLMEVNNGNSAMVKGFADADVDYPVSNSLMYSIYKMLPNDTDLTVFREYGKIQGYNFAFIDDHFNYHTAQDDIAHLSRKSVAHQGSYLMPLLNYYSSADLATLNSDNDHVYFNTPVGFFHYPFAWNYALLIIAVVLFLFLLFVGIGKRLLNGRETGRGFLRLFGAIGVAGAVAFFGWQILRAAYPQYRDILHGFTYNGHSYIAAFVFLAVAVAFLFYTNPKTDTAILNYSVAPITLWLIINLAIAIFLPGAGFLIIPVLFVLLMFGFFIITQRTSKSLNLILAIPALFIVVPFIVMFPIGLGLKVLTGSAILTVLLFALLLPVLGSFSKKLIWSIVFFIVSIGFFVDAHLNSDYASGKAKPNSLLYVYKAEQDKAYWVTYDKNLDNWTKTFLTETPSNAKVLEEYKLYSKYNSEFTYTAEALPREIAEPQIEFLSDAIIGNQRYLTIRITPNRAVNRYDIFANEKLEIHNLKANGATTLGQKGSLFPRNGRKILSYYVVSNKPLELQFSILAKQQLDMELLEASFDLLSNPVFNMKQRPRDMMPTPFVLNDAVVIIKDIKPANDSFVPVPIRKNFSLPSATSTDTIPDPDAAITE